MKKMIEINFKLSVFIAVFGFGFIFQYLYTGFPESLASVFPLQLETMMWPLIFVALTILFWFTDYRHGEGHHYAFVMGFMSFSSYLAAIISESVNNISFWDFDKYMSAYIGVSHLLYASLEAFNLSKTRK